MNEFELIRRFFQRPGRRRDVLLGIGDDAAVVRVPAGMDLVITTDLSIGGVHFPGDTDPEAVGHKVLAVNLSDLAAMGAEPAWFTLTLSLPSADAAWLERFRGGLFALADRFDVELLGGDTVRGPLAIGIEAHGFVPPGQALTRAGARPGDAVYVTGTLGDAALALRHRLGRLVLPAAAAAAVIPRLERPTPRVRAGLALRGVASACIDVSDGLAADLGHVLAASGVGARIELGRLPLSPAYRDALPTVGWNPALAHGDDYELCFTVPTDRVGGLERAARDWDCPCTRVGEIEAARGLRVVDAAGRRYRLGATGHDHFAAAGDTA